MALSIAYNADQDRTARTSENTRPQDPSLISPEGIPTGFLLGDDGIYEVRNGGEEDEYLVRICSPMRVKGLCRSKENGGWGHVVTVRDPDGCWHDVVMEATAVSRRNIAALDPLFRVGFSLGEGEKAARSVTTLLSRWLPKARYTRVTRLGWTDDTFKAFVLGNGTVIGDGKVVTDGFNGAVTASMTSRGSEVFLVRNPSRRPRSRRSCRSRSLNPIPRRNRGSRPNRARARP
ncbi:DUF927 domain-containing protein [uncultured Maritimibacter sp.]|uniref:DUF927 domain-containing protein n=1 Tax=uncultured Maritimibacter sp. TaxID=991866 RepID=UPI00345DE70E